MKSFWNFIRKNGRQNLYLCQRKIHRQCLLPAKAPSGELPGNRKSDITVFVQRYRKSFHRRNHASVRQDILCGQLVLRNFLVQTSRRLQSGMESLRQERGHQQKLRGHIFLRPRPYRTAAEVHITGRRFLYLHSSRSDGRYRPFGNPLLRCAVPCRSID